MMYFKNLKYSTDKKNTGKLYLKFNYFRVTRNTYYPILILIKKWRQIVMNHLIIFTPIMV